MPSVTAKNSLPTPKATMKVGSTQFHPPTMASTMKPDDITVYAGKAPFDKFTSLCTTVDKIQSDGLFHRSNPLHFSMPLMLLQVALATGLILFTKLLLKPLNQPIVVSQILVSFLLKTLFIVSF